MTSTALAPRPPVADPCRGFITRLVLSCAQGDEAALGELFDLTFFLVAARVSRVPLSVAGIDDEVVEAYKRIWCRSVTYQPAEQGVLAWLLDQALDIETPVNRPGMSEDFTS
jgi:hypothetical protein